VVCSGVDLWDSCSGSVASGDRFSSVGGKRRPSNVTGTYQGLPPPSRAYQDLPTSRNPPYPSAGYRSLLWLPQTVPLAPVSARLAVVGRRWPRLVVVGAVGRGGWRQEKRGAAVQPGADGRRFEEGTKRWIFPSSLRSTLRRGIPSSLRSDAAWGGGVAWGCTAVPPSRGRVYRAIVILHPSH
jgi:hypothetical protein